MGGNLLPALLLSLVLAAANKAVAIPVKTPAPPPNKIENTAEQYGTPFAQVPNPKDVILYQVNIRAFSAAGNFAGVQARLDSIRALGVNVLYLLPIYPVGILKSFNSPYCVRDYTAVNSEFGTLADVRMLVAEAHKRNMAVLFDWVADHTSWDNAWISNKSWYRQDAAGQIITPNPNWKDVAKLDYRNSDMRKAMIEAMNYWVYQANIDGYRCDAADYVPSDFWLQAIDSLRAIPGHKLLLFAEGTRKDLFTAGFQLKYGMGFYDNMVSNIYGKKGSVRSLDAINTTEYFNATADDQVVRYTSNHDVDQDGTPLDQLGGRNGSLAAFVVAAYMKGVPMIYDGQEVGCPVKLNFLNKSTTIDWKINPDMTKEYQRIVAVRNGSEAIRQGELESFSSDDICVFTKTFKTDQVLVIANLRNSAVSYECPSTLVGTVWENAFDGSESTLTAQLNLQPFQYLILKTQSKTILAQAMNTTAPAAAITAAGNTAPKASLSVPGAYQGWNPAVAPQIGSTKGSAAMFEGYVNITGSGTQPFKYTNAPDWTHINYGDGGNGTLSTDGKAGGLTVPDGGYYELTADLRKKTWTATKTTWSIMGDATPGGWQKDTQMNYDPVKQVWTVTAEMTVAGSFKFRANNAWSIDFGIDDGGNLEYVDNPFFTYNPKLRNLTVPADGNYTITLDLHVPGKYTYSLIAN